MRPFALRLIARSLWRFVFVLFFALVLYLRCGVYLPPRCCFVESETEDSIPDEDEAGAGKREADDEEGLFGVDKSEVCTPARLCPTCVL